MPPKPFLHPITHSFHGCCNFRRHPTKQPVRIRAYCQVVASKLLLEVCGAAGAVWGSSEILLLRQTPLGNEIMRIIALVVGLLFAFRFWWHAKHYYQHDRDFPPIKENHRRKWKLPFFQAFASKFVLEVLGGAGAIWGCAEAVTLRNETNAFQWRVAAGVVGTIFLIRFVFQIFAYCLCFAALWSNPASWRMTMVRWYDAFVSKLILEVFGAAGAVWGFSEIVLLRKPDTLYIWRPVACTVGVIFTIRWVFYLVSFVKAERESVPVKGQMQPSETREDEVQDLEHVDDLELAESSSGDTETTDEKIDAEITRAVPVTVLE